VDVDGFIAIESPTRWWRVRTSSRRLALGGARIITAPSAFTLETGKDHWELLVRARAVENQV